MSATDPSPPAAKPWPGPLRSWSVVVLLALASVASQFDRTVVNLAVEPLKARFDLNDTQFGYLQGIAFGVFYIIAAIPIGRLVDHYSRKWVLGICLAFFSLFSMASGLARNYAQLFLTRVGVGVGEASVTPAALSMLSDLFPAERLGRAVSGFYMSAPIGQGVAFIAGGSLLQWLATSPVLESGAFAGLEPWQAAFILIGAPGLLLVPAFLLMREPERRGPGHAAPLPLREVLAVISARSRVLVPIFASFALVSLVSYAFFIWTPALFQRNYGWNPAQVGLAFGLTVIVFSTSGVFFGGWLSDRLSARGRIDAPLVVASTGFIGCGLLGALAPLMPTGVSALALLGPALFLANIPYACGGAAMQLVVPNRARGQVTAIYITVTSLVGLTVGPAIVGMMTDYVFRDPAQIRYSLSIVVAVAAPLMFVLLQAARPHYRAARSAGA